MIGAQKYIVLKTLVLVHGNHITKVQNMQSELNKLNMYLVKLLSCSAHQTTNFTNPEFQFPQFKVLQSVFIFFLNIKSYIGIFGCIVMLI